ncbi:uncharacterized protein A4U43_C02F15010 [Asparagus officinalis]|uniref:Uncharacterized protein n=1 Tax=Asparagus officinalis TaxID=4686 RepID=A0A5P1FKA8_ASPOF|nr:uncharacterized protein A4U43_C02F15010 [Asparagus officinalis]
MSYMVEWSGSELNITSSLGEVTSLRVEKGVGSKQAAEASTPSAPEVDRLNQELDESQRKAKKWRRISERGIVLSCRLSRVD